MDRRRWMHIFAICAAIVAGVICVASMALMLPSPLQDKASLDRPVVADSGENVSAIVDGKANRLWLLNKNFQLTNYIDFSQSNTPVDAVTEVCVGGDGLIYVSGVSYDEQGAVSKERIVAYSARGGTIGVVYDRKIPDGATENSPAIRALCDTADGVLVIMWTNRGDIMGASVESFVVNRKGQVPDSVREYQIGLPFDAGCDSDGSIAWIDLFGQVHFGESDTAVDVPDHTFTAVDITNEGQVFTTDATTGEIFRIDDNQLTSLIGKGGYDDVRVRETKVIACDRDGGEVVLTDLAGNEIARLQDITIAPVLRTYAALVWLSWAYLLLFGLVAAVRKVRSVVRSGGSSAMGAVLGSMAVVLAIGIAVGFYTWHSYDDSLSVRMNEVDAYADYLEMESWGFSQSMEKAGNRAAYHGTGESSEEAIEALSDVVSPLMSLAMSSSQNGISIYYTLYARDEQGVFYVYDDREEHVVGSKADLGDNLEYIESVFDGAEEQGIMVGRSLYDITLLRYVAIPDYNRERVVGVIEIGSKMRTVWDVIAGEQLRRALALLVMVLVVYLVYAEIRACGRLFFRYRTLRERSQRDAIAILTRPFTFCVTMLQSIDSVMTVLIARELLTMMGMGESTVLLAVPAVMMGIGLVIGQIAYSVLGRHVRLRRLIVGGALVLIVLAVFTALAVNAGVFWLYCVAKLLMAVPSGMLYTLGFSLPRYAEDDKVRDKAAGGVVRTDTSAAALGTVLGGYAAQFMGDAWVYALVALLSMLVLLLAANYIDHTAERPETPRPAQVTGHGHYGLAQFFRTPVPWAIALLVLVPSTFAMGYASFLFPLFSVDAGLNKADVNNMYVLGQLVVYVCIGMIARTTARYGRRRCANGAVAIAGVLLLLVSLSQSIPWAMATIALVGVMCKTAEAWKGLFIERAVESGVPVGEATAGVLATRSIALIVQPMFLGAFLMLGGRESIIAVGITCLVCSAVFFIVSSRGALREAESQPA